MKPRSLALMGAVGLAVAVVVFLIARDGDSSTEAEPPPPADVTIARTQAEFAWNGARSVDLFQWQDIGWLHIASGNTRDAELSAWGPIEPLDRFRKLADSLDGRLRLPTSADPGTYLICNGSPSSDCVSVKLNG